MAIIGFGFNKIELEKKKTMGGKINIRSNIAVKEVEEHSLSGGAPFDKNQIGIRFGFEFKVDYGEEAGQITLTGDVISVEEKKLADKILATWKKDKKVEKEILPLILNYALSKSNVEAIALSKDINLPPPVPMPRINPEKNEKNYIG